MGTEVFNAMSPKLSFLSSSFKGPNLLFFKHSRLEVALLSGCFNQEP